MLFYMYVKLQANPPSLDVSVGEHVNWTDG